MANTNFIVHNGLTVGPLTIDVTTGTITTTGGISTSGAGSFNGTVGATTPNTGAFTTLTATTQYNGAVFGPFNGTVGATTANTGKFTTLTATTQYDGAVFGPFNGTVGATTANTGAFTTLTTSSDATIGGNLIVNGTTTTINSTTLTVDDLNIVLASGAASAAAANGAGITVDGANAQITYTNATTSWNFNKSIIVSGNIAPSANLTYDLGSTTAWFNNVYGVAIQAKYADLAEYYAGDDTYEPGTVVDFGGNFEVTISIQDASPYVAGVVSTNPAYNMNSGITAEFPIAVALTGRVPTKVTGNIQKGQMLVSAGNGRARAELNPSIGTVIGKALENFSGDDGIIEVVIGKN